MVPGGVSTIDHLNPDLDVALLEMSSNAVTHQDAGGTPAQVTQDVLAQHPDAHLDPTSKALTLPPLQPAQLAAAQSLNQLGDRAAQETGVSKVEAVRSGDEQVGLVGSINPRATLAQLAVNKPYHDAKAFYIGANEAFSIHDMPGPGGITVPGLTTKLSLSDSQARRYAKEWLRTGKIVVNPTSTLPYQVYSFKPLPTSADLLVPKNHPEYPQFMAGAALIPITPAEADLNWDLLIEGLRDPSKAGNFSIVAANLMRGVSLPPNKGALWSKGEDMSDYALSLGFQTLEGQAFYRATKGLNLINDWSVARKAWDAFSLLFASQMRGKVHVFLRKLRPDSVLVEVELNYLKTVAPPGSVDPKFHAMEWGDDPRHKLNDPVPNYWRELDGAGNPQPKGTQVELTEAQADAATQIAHQRFLDKQRLKP